MERLSLPHRPQAGMIACAVLRIGRLVVTTATLAGSPARGSSMTVGCTPGGACTDARVTRLRKATSRLLVQASRVTAAPIAKALLEAHQRGVRVEVIRDQRHRTDTYPAAECPARQGVPTERDATSAMSSNTMMLIAGEIVITGSPNGPKAAQEKHAENVLIIHDKALAAQYTQNWEDHRQHRQPYIGRGVRQ
jgi:phosphatidylserine/phosphatidylglycerophosphate/cardiolipin synthase-like enzyme